MSHAAVVYQPARRLPSSTINTEFRSWQDSTSSPPEHRSCSPALKLLALRLEERWPGWKTLGCYAPRAVRGGVSRSSHAFGAAIDLSYSVVGRQVLDEAVLPYLIQWSRPWGIQAIHDYVACGIQAIHDYVACRIWHAGRTNDIGQATTLWWRTQRADAEGMGKSWATWIHIEVTRDGWDNAALWDERGAG